MDDKITTPSIGPTKFCPKCALFGPDQARDGDDERRGIMQLDKTIRAKWMNILQENMKDKTSHDVKTSSNDKQNTTTLPQTKLNNIKKKKIQVGEIIVNSN